MMNKISTTDCHSRNYHFHHHDDDHIQHCVKTARTQNYSGPHFPAFGLNTKRYSVSFRIQFECRTKGTRITPNTDTFYAVHATFSFSGSAS